MNRRFAIALVVVSLFVASLQCRRAGGVQADPLDREAEEALAGYLKIDTSNPPGNETEGATYLQAILKKEGIESQLLGSDPKRQSLYARLSSGTSEKALLLMHHIDVVPADPAQWTNPPFSGLVSGGYLWGRGALDVKSLGIANLMAMIELKRRKSPLKRDVIYLGVADEELGGLRGAKDLLERYPELFANVGFVLNEGGFNETVLDKVTFWGVEVHQKIPLWLRFNVEGIPGHAASPPDGGGAVAKLVRGLAAVERLETPYRLTPSVRDAFQWTARVRTDARGELIGSIAEPLDPVALERDLPQGYRNLLRDTITITRVSGGTSVNVIPAKASADIDIRLLPDSVPEQMLAKVATAVQNEGSIEILLSGEAVPPSSPDTDLFRILEKRMKEDEKGSGVAPIVGAGTTDSRFFRARGVVAYGIAPFKVNYYDADSVHGTDERIRTKFFVEGVRLVRNIVKDFCVR
ncbi:MAG TPA: M20/M25/M40 family metallo-hydrolase [Thermoanaerobaculia bacterium]